MVGKKNKIKNQKKKIDEYTIEMFGKKGWICESCINFNYKSRKKCNRCHQSKNPKKIEDYLAAEKENFIGYRQYWLCSFCGNSNLAFRLVCNRCRIKKIFNYVNLTRN